MAKASIHAPDIWFMNRTSRCCDKTSLTISVTRKNSGIPSARLLVPACDIFMRVLNFFLVSERGGSRNIFAIGACNVIPRNVELYAILLFEQIPPVRPL